MIIPARAPGAQPPRITSAAQATQRAGRLTTRTFKQTRKGFSMCNSTIDGWPMLTPIEMG